MKRHIATALILGMGFAAETPQAANASERTETVLSARGPERGAIWRTSQFGHLKSAGRFRRNEIAKVFVDEGMVFAEWSGQLSAPEPRRIETEELDAEWMAHCAGGRWFLARRELVPSNSPTSLAPVLGGEGQGEGVRLWVIQVYGDAADTANLQIVATAADATANGGSNACTVNYVQSAEAARLSVRGNRDGQVQPAWSATAATLAELRERHPIIVATYLEPALAKMVC
ncbi:MAG TPA: hypothetical protein VGP99_08195 [Tepidisphaeraceae bacterium]|jgi:hypothetical protein|nr:hypothetical protein [Tepidisphaeraceae bacterium]